MSILVESPREPLFLSRIMDIGMETDACYLRWHPSSWQLTSKKDLMPGGTVHAFVKQLPLLGAQ